ncbi:MAG: hypothetical protein H3C41_05870 [Bacteroidales bacterium]|mgnify:CR=1 FL=1|nr:hypothetical protein [Bacteroidales bacterium]
MNRIKLIILFFLPLFAGCNSSGRGSDDPAVARVYDKYLYNSDLRDIVHPGTAEKDSIALVSNYIDGWIRRQLLIRQAERNLNTKQKDFSEKLEEYKNSLLTYAYESELVKQKLDTIVSESEINDYYVRNNASFQLRYNIVRAVYVVLDEKSKELRRFRSLLSDKDTIVSSTIDMLAKQYAFSYYIGDETWIRFDDLLQQVPIQTFNQELFLRNNSYIEINDKPFIYLIRIKDYRMSESISPIEMVTENIRNILINKRKQEFLRSMQDELYDRALRDGDFETF